MSKSETIAIIGAGPIAVEYARVLQHMAKPFIVLGRGEASAQAFRSKIDIPVGTGPIEDQLAKLSDVPSQAIVAVSVSQLERVSRHLLDAGVGTLLLEKPGGVDLEEISNLAAHERSSDILIAYNRRFLPSAMTAQRIIQEDGGVTSFLFEFNENIPLVRTLDQHPDRVKKNWFLANSTHVVDMAFFLSGAPGPLPAQSNVQSHIEGDASLAPPACSYVGSGRSGNAVFAYHADWRSAGRWGLELCTPNRRLVLKPLETLQEILTGSFAMSPVELDYTEPEGLKPGFYNMVSAFADKNHECFATAYDQANRLQFFAKMAGMAKAR